MLSRPSVSRKPRTRRLVFGTLVTFAFILLLLGFMPTARNAFGSATPPARALGAGLGYWGLGTSLLNPISNPYFDGTRKLPPPPGSVKPVAPDPNYRPLACLAPVVNVSVRANNE